MPPSHPHDPQLLKGVLSLLLLHLLAERESYGYEVVQRLHAIGLTGILEGTVYPALSRLEREGRLTTRLVASTLRARPQVLPADEGRLRRARRRHGVLERRSSRSSPASSASPSRLNRSKELEMARPLTWFDRLRIERVVWTLDQRLYDLPRAARIAHRRELRQNLLTAARTSARAPPCATSARAPSSPRPTSPPSSATARATRGSPRSSGPRRRCSSSPRSSPTPPTASPPASSPAIAHATGTFHWGGLSLLQNTVTCTAVDGHTTVSRWRPLAARLGPLARDRGADRPAVACPGDLARSGPRRRGVTGLRPVAAARPVSPVSCARRSRRTRRRST